MLFFVVLAVFAPLIAPYGFDQASANGVDFPTLAPPSAQHWFGTTVSGTDVFSRVVYGAQTALEVIVLAVALSIVVGVPLGLISGYLGGWLDRVLVLITDALFAFPSLLLAIVISIAIASGQSSASGRDRLGRASRSRWSTCRSTSGSFATRPSPPARSPTSRRRGRSAPRRGVVMMRYVFGNVVQTVPIIATLNAGDAILTLAGLGFLGFGIEPSSAAEWGYDLSKALSDTAAGIWWTGLFPGLAIVLIVLGVTLVGESLNDVLNPLLRTTKLRQGRAADRVPIRTAGRERAASRRSRDDHEAPVSAIEIEAVPTGPRDGEDILR